MKGEMEDWLTELPPLDGGDDDKEGGNDSDDLLPEQDDDASLDDSTAEELEVGDSLEIPDADATAGAEDENWQANVGEAELDTPEDEEPWADSDGEGPAGGDGDLDIGDEDEAGDSDYGEEGMAEPIEYSLDEELPQLDADAEGDFEDVLLSELGAAADSQPIVPERAWEATGSSPCVWPDDEDEIAAMLLRVAPDLLVALTSSGSVWMSSDGRTPAARVGAIPEELHGSGAGLLLACSGKNPVLWVADGHGRLARSTDLGQRWQRCPGPGRPILALSTHDDGTLSALAHNGNTTELLTSRDGARWFAQRISVDLQVDEAAPATAPFWLCHRGGSVAIGDKIGLWVSRGGAHFARVPGVLGASTGAFAGAAADAPLLVVTFPGESRAIQLLRVTPGEPPEIVGEIEPRPTAGEGGVLAMAWDEAAGGVRLALATELVSMAPRRPNLS